MPPSPGPGGYLLLHLGIRQGGFQSLNPRQRDGDHGFQILYLRRQHEGVTVRDRIRAGNAWY